MSGLCVCKKPVLPPPDAQRPACQKCGDLLTSKWLDRWKENR